MLRLNDVTAAFITHAYIIGNLNSHNPSNNNKVNNSFSDAKIRIGWQADAAACQPITDCLPRGNINTSMVMPEPVSSIDSVLCSIIGPITFIYLFIITGCPGLPRENVPDSDILC